MRMPMVTIHVRRVSMQHMEIAGQQQMERSIGTGGSVLLGMGSMLGTGLFVGIALATAMSGTWVLVAIAVAMLTATCNGLSSAQLAAAYPVSGGTYEYATRLLSPATGFAAGWLFLCAKSASAAAAALGAGSYLLAMVGVDPSAWGTVVGLFLLLMVTCTVLLGIRRSVLATMIILVFVGIGLLVYLVACMKSGPADESMLVVPYSAGIPGAAAIMFVAFTGYGRIATLGEEVRDPARTIPRAIIVTIALTGFLYLLIGWTLSCTAMPDELVLKDSNLNPLQSIAARSWGRAAGTVVAFAAIAAMIGVLLNLLLGLSRVVLAMARRGDVPRSHGVIWARNSTPPWAVIDACIVIAVLILVGDFTFAWSLSAFTVLIYYAITNLAALKLPAEDRSYPRWVAALGLLSCCVLAFCVPPSTWLIGLAVLAAGLVFRGMKRSLSPAP